MRKQTSASEYLMRALTSGLARTEGHNPNGSVRIAWMPGFVPIEYLRAENRNRLGVTGADPVFSPRPSTREVVA